MKSAPKLIVVFLLFMGQAATAEEVTPSRLAVVAYGLNCSDGRNFVVENLTVMPVRSRDVISIIPDSNISLGLEGPLLVVTQNQSKITLAELSGRDQELAIRACESRSRVEMPHLLSETIHFRVERDIAPKRCDGWQLVRGNELGFDRECIHTTRLTMQADSATIQIVGFVGHREFRGIRNPF
jgi:hypothetical protein